MEIEFLFFASNLGKPGDISRYEYHQIHYYNIKIKIKAQLEINQQSYPY